MKRSQTLILAILPALLLASCTSGPSELETNEAAFLTAALDLEQAHDEPRADDAQLLKLGYVVCKELEAGRVTGADAMVWAIDAYPEDGVVSATLSAATLCPEWFK